MSIFKKNPRLFGYSVQSSARRISSNVGNLVCATVLASFILCGGAKYAAAQQANVLVNPGAESGLSKNPYQIRLRATFTPLRLMEYL